MDALLEFLDRKLGWLIWFTVASALVWGVRMAYVSGQREEAECLALVTQLRGADSVRGVMTCKGFDDRNTTIAVPVPIYTPR